MKNIDKNEIDDFIKDYEKVVILVRDGIEHKSVSKEAFAEMMGKSVYSEEFIRNISSEENFKQWYERLKIEENQSCDKLMIKLKKSSRKRIRRRFVAMASGVAVVLLAVIFAAKEEIPIEIKNEIITEVKPLKIKISKPTLILSENKFITLNNRNNKFHTSDFVEDDTIKRADFVEERQLLIPKGYTYTVILDDSSEVLLNAGSELRYPSSFKGDVREVTLQGEAYFKVKKSSKPFIVKTDNACVKVYGTSFNVDAKSKDELRTLLVEGSVGVIAKNTKEVKLTPNQLSILNYETSRCEILEVVPEHYLGWKDGYFRIVNGPLEKLLLEVANWYGIDISYDQDQFKNKLLTISVERNYSLDKLINFIENTAKIKFIKEGGIKYSVEEN